MRKRIKDFPNYFIYHDGRVFSISRDRFLARSVIEDRDGNFRVTLRNGKAIRNVFVSRLVAEHFVTNDCPSVNNYVFHLDGNTRNSHYRNLIWSTLKAIRQQKDYIRESYPQFKDKRGQIDYPTTVIICDLVKSKWSFPAIKEIFSDIELSDLVALSGGPDEYSNYFSDLKEKEYQ